MLRAGGLALVAAAALAGWAEAAMAKPDLVVSALGDPPLTVVAGGSVRVAETVRNGGRARARTSSVAHYLSTDPRAGKGDVRLAARSVGALRPRGQARHTLTLRVPAGTRAGAYHVVACADAARRVAERSERNNCRASKGRVAVTLRPRPLTVTPAPDAARAVTASVGSAGGVLEATTASGASVTLEIPSGALLSDVAITMTPLSALGGLPFPRGLVGAVQLAPEGLRFLTPVTLRVTSGSPLAAGDVAGFSYSGDGAGFHLRRVTVAGGTAAVSLTHFSGAGVASASRSDRSGFAASNPPADAADQAEQQAAVPVDDGALEGAVLTMYATIVGLAQNRFTIDQAIALHNGWYPLAISSRAGALWATLHGQLTAKLNELVAAARAACVSERRLEEAGWILRLGRLSQTLVPPAPGVVQTATAAAERCVRFELDVEADLANNLEVDRGTMKARVTALPIALQNGFLPDLFSGSKDIEVLDYRIEDFDCWRHTWAPRPAAPVRVLSLELSGLNPGPSSTPGPVLVDSLELDLGSVDDQVTHTCTDGGSFTSSMAIWDLGVPSLVGSGVVSSWSPAGQGTWTRTYEQPPVPDQPSGKVTFTLRHAPLP